jgi:hypothetical protein
MNKSKVMEMAAFMMAMSHGNEFGYDFGKPVEIQPRPPKGTKEYFFNQYGDFSTESMLKSEVVFKCWASNDKNAVRKFNKAMRS